MSINLIGIEVGILLNSSDEEFDAYSINNPHLPYGFYDENQYVEKEACLEKVRKEVISYVENGVEGTYGIISTQFPARDEEECYRLTLGDLEYQFDYNYFKDKKDIVYSVCKKDGKIVVGFLESLLDAVGDGCTNKKTTEQGGVLYDK